MRMYMLCVFFFSSRRRHTRWTGDWSSDVCSSDLAGRDGPSLDAPEQAPNITSFVATPSQIQAAVATQVTWTWTYANEPTIPDPTCTIDNGVGAVTRGQ